MPARLSPRRTSAYLSPTPFPAVVILLQLSVSLSLRPSPLCLLDVYRVFFVLRVSHVLSSVCPSSAALPPLPCHPRGRETHISSPLSPFGFSFLHRARVSVSVFLGGHRTRSLTPVPLKGLPPKVCILHPSALGGLFISRENDEKRQTKPAGSILGTFEDVSERIVPECFLAQTKEGLFRRAGGAALSLIDIIDNMINESCVDRC